MVSSELSKTLDLGSHFIDAMIFPSVSIKRKVLFTTVLVSNETKNKFSTHFNAQLQKPRRKSQKDFFEKWYASGVHELFSTSL